MSNRTSTSPDAEVLARLRASLNSVDFRQNLVNIFFSVRWTPLMKVHALLENEQYANTFVVLARASQESQSRIRCSASFACEGKLIDDTHSFLSFVLPDVPDPAVVGSDGFAKAVSDAFSKVYKATTIFLYQCPFLSRGGHEFPLANFGGTPGRACDLKLVDLGLNVGNGRGPPQLGDTALMHIAKVLPFSPKLLKMHKQTINTKPFTKSLDGGATLTITNYTPLTVSITQKGFSEVTISPCAAGPTTVDLSRRWTELNQQYYELLKQWRATAPPGSFLDLLSYPDSWSPVSLATSVVNVGGYTRGISAPLTLGMQVPDLAKGSIESINSNDQVYVLAMDATETGPASLVVDAGNFIGVTISKNQTQEVEAGIGAFDPNAINTALSEASEIYKKATDTRSVS